MIMVTLSPIHVCDCSHLQNEGEDDLKKRQLMELAILNGTYRDTKSGSGSGAGSQSASPGALAMAAAAGQASRKSPTIPTPVPN